mgnify:CR=1 FL=1
MKRDWSKYEEDKYTQQYEDDDELEEEYTLEEFLNKKYGECRCPMCEGTNIGLGYY